MTANELLEKVQQSGTRIRQYWGPVEIIGESPLTKSSQVPVGWHDTQLLEYRVCESDPELPAGWAYVVDGTFRVNRGFPALVIRQRLRNQLYGNASGLGALLNALGCRVMHCELACWEADEVETLISQASTLTLKAYVDWLGHCSSCQLRVGGPKSDLPYLQHAPYERVICPRCRGTVYGHHAILDFAEL